MPRKQFVQPTNACERTLLEPPGSEACLHLATNRFPFGLLDLAGKTAIRDNLDIALGKQQVDQNAIAGLCIPYPFATKHFQCAIARALATQQRHKIARRLDNEAYFPVVPCF